MQVYGDEVAVFGIVPASVAPSTDATVLHWVEQTGVSFPVMWDESASYQRYDAVGATAPFPLDVIIDRNGIVRSVRTSYDPAEMSALIETLLAE